MRKVWQCYGILGRKLSDGCNPTLLDETSGMRYDIPPPYASRIHTCTHDTRKQAHKRTEACTHDTHIALAYARTRINMHKQASTKIPAIVEIPMVSGIFQLFPKFTFTA